MTKLKKYKIHMSMYGNVAERADVIIKAISPKKAKELAIQLAEEGDIEFTNNGESTDGWEYQVEDCEKI